MDYLRPTHPLPDHPIAERAPDATSGGSVGRSTVQQWRGVLRNTVSDRAGHLTGVCVIGMYLVLYALVAARWPYGHWDAWTIWNLRAKFVAFGPLSEALRLPSWYWHTDYPPLVGLVVGGVWRITGYTVLVPQVLHGVAFAAILWQFRRAVWAVLLVGAVGLQFAPMQVSDTPLALALLLAVIASERGQWGRAGGALGAGLLLKNEGALIALVCVVAWRDWRVVWALVPFVIAFVLFKWYADAPSDLVAPGVISRVLDGSRYPVIAGHVARETADFGHAVVIWLALLVIVRGQPVQIAPLGIAGVILAGYLVVYALTPHNITWHITTSWQRLLWQVFPIAMYGIEGKTNGLRSHV